MIFKAKIPGLASIVGLVSLLALSGCAGSQTTAEAPQLKQEGKAGDVYIPIYEVQWEVCAPPRAIAKADDSGCASGVTYVWGGRAMGESYTPKGVLLRQGVPLAAQSSIPYQVLIWSHGCFPKYAAEAGEAGFYEADRILMVGKKFAANRRVIEEVEVAVRQVTAKEELGKLAADGYGASRVALAGGSCELVEVPE